MERNKAVNRLQLVFFFTAVLMLVNYITHKSHAQKTYTVLEHNDLAFIDNPSKSPNQYTVLKHKCFRGKPLSRVNNKQGGHDSCFAACLAHNEEGLESKCAGWTIRGNFLKKAIAEARAKKTELVKKSTCFLYDAEGVSFSNPGIACTSATIWEDANLKPSVGEEDDYDDNNFYLSDIELAEYYYNKKYYQYDQLTREVADFTEPLSGVCPEKNRPERIHINCIQSSGCTLLSYLLAQEVNALSILDVGVRQKIPLTQYFMKAHESYPFVSSIVLKQALRGMLKISNEPPQQSAVFRRFKPDFSLLFMRHPIDSFLALVNHLGVGTEGEPVDKEFQPCHKDDFEELSFGLRCGTPRAKLRTLNAVFKKTDKKNLVLYEEICSHEGREQVASRLSSLGICVEAQRLHSPIRPIIEVLETTLTYFPSGKLQKNSLFWGAGDLRNTFHDEDDWSSKTEKESFRLCPQGPNGVLTESERTTFLKTASNPYNKFSLAEIRRIVEEEAPDILSYYESRAGA